MKENKLLQHVNSMASSINCLLENNHPLQAAMLTYAAIDHMAWLKGCHFKEWAHDYIIEEGFQICTAGELWAARNGLLHMGTAESRDFDNGNVEHKIFYTAGSARSTRNKADDVVFLSVPVLAGFYINDATKFIEELKQDSEMMSTALEKVKRVLKQHDMRVLF